MTSEALSHAADDKVQREEVEARNRADQMIYMTEKTLRENSSKISAETTAGIEAAIADLRKEMSAGSPEGINAAIERLTAASHQMAEQIYRQTTGKQDAQGGEPAGSPRSGQQGEVIDAEYVDVDEKK